MERKMKEELIKRAREISESDDFSYKELIKLFKDLGWEIPRGKRNVPTPTKVKLFEALKKEIMFLDMEGEPLSTFTESPAGGEVSDWHERRNLKY